MVEEEGGVDGFVAECETAEKNERGVGGFFVVLKSSCGLTLRTLRMVGAGVDTTKLLQGR